MNDTTGGSGGRLGLVVGLLVAAVIVIGLFVFNSNSGPDDMDLTVHPPQDTAPSGGGGTGN